MCRAILESTERNTVELIPVANTDFGTPQKRMPTATVVALAAAVVLIVGGTFGIEPGGGITLAILLVAPLARTVMVVGRRSQKGDAPSALATISMFGASMFVTWVVLTVVVVAAFGSFCLTCLGVAIATNESNAAIPAGAIAALIVVAIVVRLFGKWIRARWKRDIGEG